MKSRMQTILESKAGAYRWHENWAKIPANPAQPPNGRTHGVVEVRDGRIFVFHQANPGILIYSAQGELLESWGNYPGAHGIALVEEDGVEFLWLVDQETAHVEKVTLEGKLAQRLEAPAHAAYEEKRYVPTWAAVNERRHGGNGDIWVADGYGASLIHRYNAAGQLLATLDGTTGAGRFSCPHGIAFDPRKATPELYVADRGNHRVQVFDGEGSFLRSFGAEFLSSPDGFVFSGGRVIVPELFGRVAVLDGEDRLLDYLGEVPGAEKLPGWPNDNAVCPGGFNSPHGAGADAAGNLFVVEWRVGGRIIKLERAF